jgi:hypothetical protein
MKASTPPPGRRISVSICTFVLVKQVNLGFTARASHTLRASVPTTASSSCAGSGSRLCCPAAQQLCCCCMLCCSSVAVAALLPGAAQPPSPGATGRDSCACSAPAAAWNGTRHAVLCATHCGLLAVSAYIPNLLLLQYLIYYAARCPVRNALWTPGSLSIYT